MRAAQAMIEVLRDEGIDRVFGNPGTTELPFVDAVAESGIPYVLGTHEGSLVATADGYARATRRVSFVSLHVAAGLANGLIGMLNAARSRTPMVVTAGQQDSRHLVQEPMLSGDLVALAAGASKQALEVHRAEDVGVVLRRAFRLAVTPPAGPVFVSIPMDLLEEDVAPPPARTAVDHARPPAASGIAAAADLLRGARRPVVVAGDEVGRGDAVAELVAVAEALGAPVFHQPMNDAVDFPMDHPLYAGMLVPENERIRKELEGHDVVLLAGARAFVPHHWSEGPALTAEQRIVQLGEEDAQLGRNYPVEVALLGDVRRGLAALSGLLAGSGTSDLPARRGGRPAPLTTTGQDGVLDPRLAAATVAASLPEGAVVIEEAITTGLLLREELRLSEPGSFHHTVGGGLGWGIGAAVGVALARPDRPVVAALGDGCALFGVHGLWTAANQGTATTFVVFANGEYRTLKQTLTRMRGGRSGGFPGMDLVAPTADWPALAGSLGVPGVRVGSADELAERLAARTAGEGPLLLEVPVTAFAG